MNQAVNLLIRSGISSKQLRQLRERFGTLRPGLDVFPHGAVFAAALQHCALPLITLFSQPACDVILVVLLFLLMLEGLVITTIALSGDQTVRQFKITGIALSLFVLVTGQLAIFTLTTCGFNICFGTQIFYIFADFVISPLILCALIVGPVRIAGVPFLGSILTLGLTGLGALRETPVHPVLEA